MKPLSKNWLFRNKLIYSELFKIALSKNGKSYFFFLFILLFSLVSPSQNLVPNSSFEINSSCPDTNPYGINYVIQWTGAGTSVDYYNTCATSSSFLIPSQGWGGFQFPKTGNAYVGLSVYYLSMPPYTREYLQTNLLDTLVSNNCYLVTFYANLCNGCVWGVNNLAANFSASNFTDSLEQLVSLPLHIYKYGNPIITDTANWVEIKGIYKASGGEKFMTIGDFKDGIETDTLTVNNTTFINGGYYLIDDVSVIPIDSIPGGISANAGNDTTIIGGDSVFIGQEITNLYCNWYIGATLIADSISGIFVSPTTTTTYTVEQNLCGTITYDTVTVFVSGVGINENVWSNSISLYPNPSNGEFKIEFKSKDKSDALLEIVDVTGSLVYTQNLQLTSGMSNFKLDISNGVYFVHITNTRNHETFVKKMVIQK